MPEQFGDKTHDATPHRREKAREQGQVSRSQDLTSAILLVVGLVALMNFGDNIASWFTEYTRHQLSTSPNLSIDQSAAVALAGDLVSKMAQIVLPIIGLLLLASIAANVGQVGVLFLPQKVTFDISKISLMSGMKRLFALSNFVRAGFGLFKVIVVASVGILCLWADRDRILGITAGTTLAIASVLVEVILWTCLKIGIALLILAIFDFAFQRWKFEQDIRMTDQEVKDEMKTMQGDPQMIARRRAVQRQLVMNRLNTAIPQADVVVTNPTELAIAIKYDLDTMAAPTVVAKGAGMVAQRIRRLALENSVPIVERKELAQALYKQVEVNQQIPADTYAAMAEVLKYVYELKGKTLPTLKNAA